MENNIDDRRLRSFPDGLEEKILDRIGPVQDSFKAGRHVVVRFLQFCIIQRIAVPYPLLDIDVTSSRARDLLEIELNLSSGHFRERTDAYHRVQPPVFRLCKLVGRQEYNIRRQYPLAHLREVGPRLEQKRALCAEQSRQIPLRNK